jgi:hypothetical protein
MTNPTEAGYYWVWDRPGEPPTILRWGAGLMVGHPPRFGAWETPGYEQVDDVERAAWVGPLAPPPDPRTP